MLFSLGRTLSLGKILGTGLGAMLVLLTPLLLDPRTYYLVMVWSVVNAYLHHQSLGILVQEYISLILPHPQCPSQSKQTVGSWLLS
jgi:hypothetical protein